MPYGGSGCRSSFPPLCCGGGEACEQGDRGIIRIIFFLLFILDYYHKDSNHRIEGNCKRKKREEKKVDFI